MVSRPWLKRIREIPTMVNMGTITQSVGNDALETPSLNISFIPIINLIVPKNNAPVVKKADNRKLIPMTVSLWLIAAGAARPTPIIAKAKLGNNWANELLAVLSKLPWCNTWLKKLKYMRPADIPIRMKTSIEIGKSHSMTTHRPGIKMAPIINITFTLIAYVSGIAISWVCALVPTILSTPPSALNLR